MVSYLRVAVGAVILLTLLSAAAGLWVYRSHISPIVALAEKRSIGDVLDQIKYMKYTMDYDGKTYSVEVFNDPKNRRGEIVATFEDKTIRYSYNYTSTLVFIYVNSTVLSPGRYLGSFATNVDYVTEGNIKMEPFPGIAPIYALNFIGNATNINWGSFVSTRGERVPQNVRLLFANVKTSEGEARGSEVYIEGYQLASVTEGLKWYTLNVRALLARVGPIAVAWELEIESSIATAQFYLKIKLERLELAS